jgi:hypothetical protein
MSRTVKLSKATQIGSSFFPSGASVTLDDKDADELISRGHIATEAGHGKATITSGTATVKVAHGLGALPSGVFLTGTHAEVSAAVVTAVDGGGFTITVPANTTANRDVYWYVRP